MISFINQSASLSANQPQEVKDASTTMSVNAATSMGDVADVAEVTGMMKKVHKMAHPT